MTVLNSPQTMTEQMEMFETEGEKPDINRSACAQHLQTKKQKTKRQPVKYIIKSE